MAASHRIIWYLICALVVLNLLVALLSHFWPLLLLIGVVLVAGRLWLRRTWL